MAASVLHVRLTAAVVAGAALLLVAGCSSDADHGAPAGSTARQASVAATSAGTPATAARTSATSATPGPATSPPTVVTTKAAAERYRQIVAPLNRAAAAMDRAKGWTKLSTVREPLTRYLAAEDTFARDLLAYHWPASVEPTARRLASAVLENRAALRRALEATTDYDAVTLFNAALDRDTSVGIATELRIGLGLPSN